MKKLMFTFGIGVLTVLGSQATVNATEVTTDDQTTTTDTEAVEIELKDGGITPDSALYGLDKMFEKISLSLTFNDEKEANKRLEIAEERLGELQELDEDELDEYANELYEEYGINLETANEILSELITKGKVEGKDLEELQDKLGDTTDAELAVDDEKKETIDDDVKDQVKDVQTKAYAISVATGLDKEQVSQLKEDGYGYGEILKLTAFAEMADMTIEELLYLDIFEEDEDGKIEVDFGKLAEELGIEKDAVKEQFKSYKDVVKETRKANKDEKRANEQKDEFKKDINEKVSGIIARHKDEFLTKIDEVYNARLQTIESLDLPDDKKAELINKLDKTKVELIENVQEKVADRELNPRDLGQLNREIAKEFNQVLEDFDLSDEDKEEIRKASDDIETQTNNLVDQVVKRIEERTNQKLEQADIDKIKADILEEAKEHTDEDTSERLGDIQEKIIKRLEEVSEKRAANTNDKGREDTGTRGKGRQNQTDDDTEESDDDSDSDSTDDTDSNL